MTAFDDEARRSREAQQLWQSRPLRERLPFLQEVRNRLVEQMEELCEAVATDVKRDAAEVAATDLLPSAALAKYLSENASGILSPKRVRGSPLWLKDCTETIFRRPHGVVGVIGTWNYPVYLTLSAILPALVAGNSILWKPSENTPRTAKLLDEILTQSGLPTNLLIALPIERDAGPRLCESAIDFLHFTGSDRVGRQIAARLGERLIPSTLELSGCDAFIVRPDADLALAARTAWYGTTLNHGQTCIATRRAFVPHKQLEAFVNVIQPLLLATTSRPLVTPGQSAQFQSFLTQAREAGVTVVTATESSQDKTSPALIIDPPAHFPACVDASFAPILSVLSYTDEAELLNKIGHSPFGLSGAIFTADAGEAELLAAKLRTGSVIINDVIVPTANPATPFGGRGASGWGVTGGAEGLLAMTVPQVVSRRRGRFRPHVDAALNHDPALPDALKGLLQFSHARRWRDRWRGFRRMLAGVRKRRV